MCHDITSDLTEFKFCRQNFKSLCFIDLEGLSSVNKTLNPVDDLKGIVLRTDVQILGYFEEVQFYRILKNLPSSAFFFN